MSRTRRGERKVVYGATDSVLVLLRGASLSDAFRAGQEMATVVSALQPEPMKLKFEKVCQPALLLVKKRYVGRMFEHSARDSCGIVRRNMGKVLELLIVRHLSF